LLLAVCARSGRRRRLPRRRRITAGRDGPRQPGIRRPSDLGL